MFKVMLFKPLMFNGCRRKSTYLPVADFYSGRSLLITGGTGFLGKVLIESLLYNCREINKIYFLVRDSNGVKGVDRLNTILNVPLFQRIKLSHPQYLNKLVPVSGDIVLPNLGLSPKDADILSNEVSVVFHCAASVKFKDNLKSLLLHNTKGTQEVVDFSKTVKNLEVLVHVSSAYSNSEKKHIEEIVYPPTGKLEEIYKIAEKYDENPKAYNILNGKKNTYTMTKALAEDIVAESNKRDNLPAIIVRPSIISPVYKNGLPGWVDSWFGATSLITTVSKGICHVVRGNKNNIIDLIPVDYVASSMIVAAARFSRDTDVPVYNVCTSSANPITMKELRTFILKHNHLLKSNLPAGAICTESEILYNVTSFLTETLPAFVVDTKRKLTGQKPWYNKLLWQLSQQREVLDPFTSGSWIMHTSNTEYLCFSMSPEDKKKYQLHPMDIDWDEYIRTYLEGIDKYMMKKKTNPVKSATLAPVQ